MLSNVVRPKKSYNIIQSKVFKEKGFLEDIDYSITLRVTDICNLHCHYCHWNEGEKYKTTDIKLLMDNMVTFCKGEGFKNVIIYFHGGEPSSHRDIIEILQYIRKKFNDSGITPWLEFQTNLTMKVDLLDEIYDNVDLLNMTYHYAELKRRHKLEIFKRNFQWLVDNEKNISNFDVMLEDLELNELIKFHNNIEWYLGYNNIKNSEMIYGYYNYDSTSTSNKNVEFYRKHNKTEQLYEIDGTEYTTNELFARGLDCEGLRCDTGKVGVMINGNGDTYLCGAHLTVADSIYTNVIKDKVALKKLSLLCKTGTTCKWDRCAGDFYWKKYV